MKAGRSTATRRHQRMIDDCIANHGDEDNCVREADTKLRAENLRAIHLRAPANSGSGL